MKRSPGAKKRSYGVRMMRDQLSPVAMFYARAVTVTYSYSKLDRIRARSLLAADVSEFEHKVIKRLIREQMREISVRRNYG